LFTRDTPTTIVNASRQDPFPPTGVTKSDIIFV
jgi:hypothetical protein